VQEEQSGVGWIARSDVGKLSSTGETHSSLGGRAHVEIPFCCLEPEFNSDERREFPTLPKSVGRSSHARAVRAATGLGEYCSEMLLAHQGRG
ncbi:hypothetical protein, partial [Mesorhizobium sp. M5C.F.Ca.IN.020.32.2.1]|uniref:hypothetical protein n=1 Tax=Mesorhizobium sp. M5C.F.Ca.IN.020.32.2.1 TaxID=2496771 RepID=UPI0019D4EA25